MSNSLFRNNRPLWTNLTIIILLLAAAFFRLPDLGELGFYGDEETTSFPARSVAQGNGPKMPSGLPYYRALPLTFLNAISASLIGDDEELSYRLPAAIFGVLTPLALFLLSRGLVPPILALAAAFLLILSDWHIITSREARMYAPYMLCFLSTGLLFLRWAEHLDFRRAVIIAGFVALTLTMHSLGLLFVLIPLTWIVLKSEKISKWTYPVAIIVFTVLFYILVNRHLILQAFPEWINSIGQAYSLTPLLSEAGDSSGLRNRISEWTVLGFVSGALLGAWLGRCLTASNTDDCSWITMSSIVLLSVCFGSFLLSANFYAAGLAGVSLLLVRPVTTVPQLRQCYGPIVLLAIAGIAVGSYLLATTASMFELREYLRFPYPYFMYFWQYSPGLMILFWAGVISSIFAEQQKWIVNIRLFSLVAIGIVAGLGVVSQWGGMRYLIGAYPFILLVASFPLFWIQSYFFRQGKTAGYIGFLMLIGVILWGAVEGHSFGAASAAKNLSYGKSNHALILGFDIYPDHKGAGQYVMQHADDLDLIIVEDALQQYWYTGRELVWLRDEVSNGQFMYFDSAGILRDIYVNSRVLRSTDPETLCNDHASTIWLVTSAETEFHRDLYLSDEQRQWLDNVTQHFRAVYVGRDDTTSVYKLSCSQLKQIPVVRSPLN